jgi:hypothetical protein
MRPSALIAGAPLAPSGSAPSPPVETSVVWGVQSAGAPAHVSRTKIFLRPVLASLAGSAFTDTNATYRPPALIAGEKLSVREFAAVMPRATADDEPEQPDAAQIVNGTRFDKLLPAVCPDRLTATVAVPAVLTSADEMDAVSLVLSTKVVARSVSPAAPGDCHCTLSPETNPLPSTSNVKAALPAGLALGDRKEIELGLVGVAPRLGLLLLQPANAKVAVNAKIGAAPIKARRKREHSCQP